MWKSHPFRLVFTLRLKAAILGAHYEWRELTGEGLEEERGEKAILGGHVMIHS